MFGSFRSLARLDWAPMYRDRKGRVIKKTLRWAALFERMKYRRIGQRTTRGGHWISTVWLGMNHNFSMSPRGGSWFETMIFCEHEDCPLDGEQWRYDTEKQALKAHRTIVHAVYIYEKARREGKTVEEVARDLGVAKGAEESSG